MRCPALRRSALISSNISLWECQPTMPTSSGVSLIQRALTGRRANELLGGGSRLGGDLGAGQHPGDLLAAPRRFERGDAGRHPLALLQRVLGDEIMPFGARRDLRRVG